MSRTSRLLVVILAIPVAAAAVACGPDFPWRLLEDRDATLKGTPANLFAFDAARFVKRPAGVPDAVNPVEIPYWKRKKEPQVPDRPGEGDGLQPGQIEIVRRMRTAASLEEAEREGAALPDELRLYTAGAVAFGRQDWAAAAERFEKVLALPADQQRLRGLWAAYSLGRTRFGENNLDAAEAAFLTVRDRVTAGEPDPQGLASASLGERARIQLERASGAGDERAPFFVAATRLYAEQASTGAEGAPLSLRMVVQNKILDQPGMLEATITDPVIQRVVVSYALTRTLDGDEPGVDAGLRRKGVEPNSTLVRVVEAAARSGSQEIAGADRLAAAAYRAGQYPLARQMAARSASPLGAWVLAKIAVQDGDVKSALKHYATAVRGVPTAPDALEPWMQSRLAGEFATATLSTGQIADAFDMLYQHPTEFWLDVAYVADRLLGLSELKRYVDRKVPPVPPGTRRDRYDEDNPQTWQPIKPPATALRDLLARRLVREGRVEEALPYFDRSDVRERAKAYAKALRSAETTRNRTDRAKALYAAGMLTRRSGMEMMGTEDAPDFFVYGGSYAQEGIPDGQSGPFVPRVEPALAKRSAPRPDMRFHYRFRAYEHMMKAADNLPPKSQESAAVLCRAAEFMRITPGGEDLYRKAYRRYRASGVSLDVPAPFGRTCPDPVAFGAPDPLFEEPPHEPIVVPAD